MLTNKNRGKIDRSKKEEKNKNRNKNQKLKIHQKPKNRARDYFKRNKVTE